MLYSDRLIAELSDDSDDSEVITPIPIEGSSLRPPQRPSSHGIQFETCKHVFCGACLAQAIYHALNFAFDPANYGTILEELPLAAQGMEPEFPICCPQCRGRAGEQAPEISDRIAQLVLGPGNMEEWSHQRYLSKLNLIYCPHKNCGEQFDADDVDACLIVAWPFSHEASKIAPAPTSSGVQHALTLAQCPRCGASLCKSCKSVWHEKLTCEAYQALPLNERAPEDIAFTDLAQQEKWRRCPKCSAMVELKSGCNHITCVCKHHFCYQCGADFEHTNGRYRCTGGRGCEVWKEQNLLDHK
ncbi:RBR-type E3 ubiquitin transferase [Mycena indigotica]|uniref:RBR-type E3 ubiquitin transferase n=1 Tax=Mycena indigotica TaxID=2126181 RepID=A0A8H6VTX8_9AGAR|nr:RBR-type E3 ubiquitin transferase [Mycena indigotica]KAF7289983.1 RBR-type E3 ubiquitin transferase [Mycena indigotica]